MKRMPLMNPRVGLVAWWVAAIPVASALADGPGPASPTAAKASAPAPPMPPALAPQAQAVTDAVLGHHIDPPARQQMILSGIRALYRAAGAPAPPDLVRRVSAAATPDQFAAILRESWPRTTARPVAADRLWDAFFEGLLAPVPGRAYLMTAKESKVTESFAGNRYVGIHVALRWEDKEKLPVFNEVFPGGPADKAGVKAEDRLEQVDGVEVKGTTLRQVVDRLRGDEGTDVTIKIRTPKEPKSRTLKITRGQLPRTTVEGIRKQPSGGWAIRVDGPDPIGYLKIKEIGASTPHELRKLARQMEDQGLRALVLDLRGTTTPGGPVPVHAAALLADSLLESGPIGRVRTVLGETTFQADPDALFRGWPIAVLADETTSSVAEWIAAALKDNHRAVVVGRPTQGSPLVGPESRPRFPEAHAALMSSGVDSTVPVGDGQWVVSMVTGYLERGDGRPLSVWVAYKLGDPDASSTTGGGVEPDETLPADRARTSAGPGPIAKADPASKPIERTYAAAVAKDAPRSPGDDPVVTAALKVLHDALEKRR